MTRIRFREGSWHYADDAARLARGEETLWLEPENLEEVEPAKPGDIWRIHWAAGPGEERQFAGYAICCNKCGQVHAWTTALNCSSKREIEGGGSVCEHSGKGSCWQWSGSAEEGTLTAHPSLHCLQDRGGCGYHGWLQNGDLTNG